MPPKLSAVLSINHGHVGITLDGEHLY
jgi:hypothetical protein